MKARLIALCLLLSAAPCSHAGVLKRGRVQLICHRTANRDVPENTLESLALAARMGCDIVEVDIRMTRDGKLVLNHDGMLERLTDGMGDVESTSFDELELYDYGSWMSPRFAGMRVPLFSDALRVAREQGIALHLDVKEKGQAPAIYNALVREGMLEHVIFGGESGNFDDLQKMYPHANADPVAWLGPEPTAQEVSRAHTQGQFVVANFSENSHQMDMVAMRAAVAAGVDALNVDYPRLGADALDRPVEAKLATLATAARSGTTPSRIAAIQEISRYSGFPTRSLLARLLLDPDQQVSRAAAVALVTARPTTPSVIFLNALRSPELSARINAAWGLGMTHASAVSALLPLLASSEIAEQREVLLALSRCPGELPVERLAPFLGSHTPTVRAAAALALASHQPASALEEIPKMIARSQQHSAKIEAQREASGNPPITSDEIARIVEDYREQMKLVHALESLPAAEARTDLAQQTVRFTRDYSHVMAAEAGNQMWDRITGDPTPMLQALASPHDEVADRAEYILTKAPPELLPALRSALPGAPEATKLRLIRVLAWQGDGAALPLLQQLARSEPDHQPLLAWAIAKIRMLSFEEEQSAQASERGYR